MNSTSFVPDWVSAPGRTIRYVLKRRAISQNEFARRLQLPEAEAEALLEGRLPITLAVARRLEAELGASVSFWMSRDAEFREDAVRQADYAAEESQWLGDLPVTDMVRFGWVSPRPHVGEELTACLRFFGVGDVPSWRQQYADIVSQAAYRTSPSFDSRPASVAAWIRQGERLAAAMDCAPWNPEGFLSVLSRVRSLTRIKEPERFLPRLQQLCSENGVAVVVARAPSGCRASGATLWVAPDKALLLLSFRFLTDDHFWFTFFHEAGHLLLHREHQVILEGLASDADASQVDELWYRQIEEEANTFAARILVPPDEEAALNRIGSDATRVIRFASRLGIAPGIVVGQLHHRGLLPRNRLNSLRRRYRWPE